MLNADDLGIIAGTFEDFMKKLAQLKVNMGETQVIILGIYLHTFQNSGECSCAVCRKVDGKN